MKPEELKSLIQDALDACAASAGIVVPKISNQLADTLSDSGDPGLYAMAVLGTLHWAGVAMGCLDTGISVPKAEEELTKGLRLLIAATAIF